MKIVDHVSSVNGKAIVINGGSKSKREEAIKAFIDELSSFSSSTVLTHDIDATGKSHTIDSIRNFIRQTSYSSLQTNSMRVFIIYGAETLTPLIQNTLLKTFEELSDNHCFILETSRVESLIPTIKSRVVIETIEDETSVDSIDVSLLLTKSLPELFLYAEEYSDSTEKAQGVISSLLSFVRLQIKKSPRNITYINYSEFLITHYELLVSTNVSTRLVLENCVLNFYNLFIK